MVGLSDIPSVGKVVDKDVEQIEKKHSFSCIQCLPIPNPVSRFRIGRAAKKDAKLITELTASGKELLTKDIAAYLEGPSQDVENMTSTAFMDFPSRKVAYGKLWEQLVSEDSLIIGIYGMPGVGKTRMMEQIWKDAQSQEKKVFDKVTLAVVGSVTIDVIKLQDQLARSLKCDLKLQDDIRTRANQLKKCMMNSGKMLIIFDDVWGQISLYDIIGTSYDDINSWSGCKILFTSQEKFYCLNNKCKKIVQITTLKDEEALDMLKNTLGTDQIDSLQDESLVMKVCKRCAGLPLVIHAVGNALKFKIQNIWEEALKKLEDCEIENISGVDPKVYVCLKLSFDNLPEDAKQCLLLCSLFFADEVISIETLIWLATGSQIVKGGRLRVCAMVNTLKSSSLLLPEGEDDQNFKLHDIIRGVVRTIAFKDYSFLTEKCDPWLPGDSADYAAGRVLHLELAQDDFEFPAVLVCPDLHTLWLRSLQEWQFQLNNIPGISGGMFTSLRCLVLSNFSWQQLYIQSLDTLKTLIFLNCKIGNTDIISCFPKSVKILYIWDCYLPTFLDLEELTNLRELDISVKNRSQMVPDTISRLSRLEELHLQESIDDITDICTIMPNFKEISELTCLTSLKIIWNDFDPSDQDTSIFHNLIKFDIRVGVVGVETANRPASHAASTRLIELSGKQQFECLHCLVEKAEEVILQGTAVEISMIWESNKEAFKDLRNLYIYSCDTLEYLARIPKDEIQPCLQQQTSFSRLTIIEVSSCESLKYLFNNTVAERLVQLQKLAISDCNAMEVVVMNDGPSDGPIINFSKLKSLKMSKLYDLKSFYGEEKDMQSSSTSMIDNPGITSVQSQSLFDGMVAFPSLEVLHIKELYNISDIWGKNYNDNSSFCKLNSLDGFTDVGIIVFPQLTELNLCDLPNLTGLCSYRSEQANSYKVKFPNLVKFTLKDLEINLEWMELNGDDFTCKLNYLSMSYDEEKQLPSTWKLLSYNLGSLILRHCCSDVLKSLCFFKGLKVLQVIEVECSTLFSLPVLRSLQQLLELKVSNCPLLEEIVEDVRDDEASVMVKETITLFHLRSVSLENLPKLKGFIHGANYELHMPDLISMEVISCGRLSTLFTCSVFQKLQQLQELHVGDCDLLEAIVADEKGVEISGTDDKIIILPRLSSVMLMYLPNLKSFVHINNYEIHMPALILVQVEYCGLPTLFTFSVFQTLQQLDELKVVNCDFLEGIVADERGIKTSGTKIITLPQLSLIMLYGLPNLKSFNLAVCCALNMPKLHSFGIYFCPRLKNMSSLKTSTGLVRAVAETLTDREDVTDLNDYIRQYHKLYYCAKHQVLKVSLFSFSWSCSC